MSPLSVPPKGENQKGCNPFSPVPPFREVRRVLLSLPLGEVRWDFSSLSLFPSCGGVRGGFSVVPPRLELGTSTLSV